MVKQKGAKASKVQTRSTSKQISELDEELSGSENECSCDCENQNRLVLDQVETLKNRIHFLEQLVVKLSNSQLHTKDIVTNLQSHSMRDNIIISGVSERQNEDAEDEVVNFINNKLEVEFDKNDIVRAHRTGDRSTSKGARPIVVKISDGRKKDKILKNSNKLKGVKGHNGKPLFVSSQQPEAIVEKDKQRRFKLKQLHAENNLKPTAQKQNIKVVNGKIMVGNEVQKPRLSVPTIDEMLNVNDESKQRMKAVKFVRSEDILDDGSIFFSYACPVNSVNDVRTAYLKAKMVNPGSADVMAAYSVTYDNGKKLEEYFDDREVGAGSRIYSAIQMKGQSNCAVFVVRYWNRTHIGPRRFKHIKDSALAALNKLFE